MSTSNTGPGGVRNLRAMFENKASNDQASSPPSRGRSPNGSVTSTQDRPLSKVRTNFVAVERPNEEGRPQSAARKLSEMTLDGATESIMAADNKGLGEILKGSPFLDEGEFPPVSRQTSTKEPQSNGFADRAAAMVKKIQQGKTTPPPTNDSIESSATPKITIPSPTKSAIPETKLSPVKNKSTPIATKQSPVETNSPTVVKGPVVKPIGGISKIKGIIQSAANAEEGRKVAAVDKVEPEEGPSQPTTSTEPTNGVKSEQTPSTQDAKTKGVNPSRPYGTPESSSRNNQVRSIPVASTNKNDTVKEPTKSIPISKSQRTSLPMKKLPTATAATTTASSARTDEPRTTDTRPADKKTTKIPPRVANVTTASTLAKKSSRASLNATDGTKSRNTTRPADEGFLARMMRPTASSAQKAHDKIQVNSPPRPKQNARILSAKPSRRSLSRADENKENESDEPPVPPLPQEVGPNGSSASSQQVVDSAA